MNFISRMFRAFFIAMIILSLSVVLGAVSPFLFEGMERAHYVVISNWQIVAAAMTVQLGLVVWVFYRKRQKRLNDE